MGLGWKSCICCEMEVGNLDVKNSLWEHNCSRPTSAYRLRAGLLYRRYILITR